MVGLLQLFFVGHAKEPATEGLQHVQSEHCCKSHYLNIASILHELHWLPVKMCIDYKILSLVVCSCRHGTASQYLRELIPCYLSVPVSVTLQPVSSSHPPVLTTETATTTKCGVRAFSSAAPKLWNSLPSTLRGCLTQSLKTSLSQRIRSAQTLHQ